MTTKQDSDQQKYGKDRGERDSGTTTSRRALGAAVLVPAVAAVLLWGASMVTWGSQRFRTPFSGDVTYSATGATVRPELVPVALAALASIAAVLAAGRWLRRVLGVVFCLAGALLVWRDVDRAPMSAYPGVPAGSTPIGAVSASPLGPLLLVVAAVALIGAGVLIVRYAGRLPEMGAKYSAPGAKRRALDPDKRLWDALDEGHDPTAE